MKIKYYSKFSQGNDREKTIQLATKHLDFQNVQNKKNACTYSANETIRMPLAVQC